MKKTRGFTLLEMMVASVIAFLIVAAGSELAAAMARNVKRAEEQGDLGMRAAIGHEFLSDILSATAYNWTVPHALAASVTTGSLGEGGCAASTGMCAADGQIAAPLQICDGPSVTQSSCAAPTTTTSDALSTYIPRDTLIDAVAIADRNTTPLTSACDASNVPSTTVFDVKGVNASAWAVNDLVLVTHGTHATIGTVRAAFAVGSDPNVTRQISLDVGTGTTLAFDDGTSAVPCNALASLRGAKVMRIQQVIIRHDQVTRTVFFSHRESGAAALVNDPILSDVDDLQFQLDLARLPPLAAGPGICTSNTTAIFDGTALTTAPCATEVLDGTPGATSVIRVIGLRAGILLRTAVETQTKSSTTTGLFDRTGTSFTDKRLRRTSFVYLGLPNAASL